MDTTAVVNSVITFLGGGIIVAVFEWLRTARSERIARKVAFLSDQVRFLYGPLHLFVVQNRQHLDMNHRLQDAFIKIGTEKVKAGLDVSKDLSKTPVALALGNDYVALVRENNNRMMDIIQQNYCYIDADDVDILGLMMADYARTKTEFDASGRLKTPMDIYQRLGDVCAMRQEFAERVTEKFYAKKNEIQRLAG